MKYLFLKIIFLLWFCSASGYESRFNSDNKPRLSMEFQMGNGSSYLDKDGNNIHEIKQSQVDLNTPNRMLFDFNYYSLNAGYYRPLTEKLQAAVNLALRYYTLEEMYYLQNSDLSYYYKNSKIFSDFRLDNFCLLVRYKIYNARARTYVYSELKVPGNFQTGSPGDSSRDFLGNKPTEWNNGLQITIEEAKINLSSLFLYSLRSADWGSRFIIKTTFNIETVKDTRLQFNLDYVNNLSGSLVSAFNMRRFQPAETYLDVSAGFGIFISSDVAAIANYAVRLYGKNCWSNGSFSIKFDYFF